MKFRSREKIFYNNFRCNQTFTALNFPLIKRDSKVQQHQDKEEITTEVVNPGVMVGFKLLKNKCSFWICFCDFYHVEDYVEMSLPGEAERLG